MHDYRLSVSADQDLEEIYLYSFGQFGEKQADQYLSELETCFQQLVAHPHIGRDITHIREGYFRFEYQQHSVFYKLESEGIFIVRVLHRARDIEAIL